MFNQVKCVHETTLKIRRISGFHRGVEKEVCKRNKRENSLCKLCSALIVYKIMHFNSVLSVESIMAVYDSKCFNKVYFIITTPYENSLNIEM